MELKKIKDPFDLEYSDRYGLEIKHGTLHVEKVIRKIVDTKYKASVSRNTPKCCRCKMKHLGDKLEGTHSGDCFRPGESNYYYYHIYQCVKCKKEKKYLYSHQHYEDSNR